jgi:FHS family L-fucose permease-like MFS transporter
MHFTRDLRPGEADMATTDKLRDHPQLFLGAIGIFLYVGAEVAIGSFLINYFQLPAIGNLKAREASLYVSLYWGGAMLGRFIGSAILRRFSTGVVLGIHVSFPIRDRVGARRNSDHIVGADLSLHREPDD